MICQKNCYQTVCAYERACQSLQQAEEEVKRHERKFENSAKFQDFDVSSQEVLNQAVIKVSEAKQNKMTRKIEHENVSVSRMVVQF